LPFDRELQLNINMFAAIIYSFMQADEILPKISALKQYYVCKQELVCLRAWIVM